jgi:hypothetical protein
MSMQLSYIDANRFSFTLRNFDTTPECQQNSRILRQVPSCETSTEFRPNSQISKQVRNFGYESLLGDCTNSWNQCAWDPNSVNFDNFDPSAYFPVIDHVCYILWIISTSCASVTNFQATRSFWAKQTPGFRFQFSTEDFEHVLDEIMA